MGILQNFATIVAEFLQNHALPFHDIVLHVHEIFRIRTEECRWRGFYEELGLTLEQPIEHGDNIVKFPINFLEFRCKKQRSSSNLPYITDGKRLSEIEMLKHYLCQHNTSLW